MTRNSDSTGSDTRRHGVDLGRLETELDSREYPVTREELVAEYGDYELELPRGSETLREVLERQQSDEADEERQFDSPIEVRQTILGLVGSDAVGREDYSDRGGTLRETTDENSVGNGT